PRRAARPGDHLPALPAQGADEALRQRAATGGGPAPLRGGRADRGPAGGSAGAGPEVGPAPAGGGGAAGGAPAGGAGADGRMGVVHGSTAPEDPGGAAGKPGGNGGPRAGEADQRPAEGGGAEGNAAADEGRAAAGKGRAVPRQRAGCPGLPRLAGQQP